MQKLEPAESQPEMGSIYLLPGILPAVAAINPVIDSHASLVTWGLGLPVRDQAWTLLLFDQSNGQTAEKSSRELLPPDAELLLAWNDLAGNRVMSFRGTGQVADWMARFDRQFGSRINPKSNSAVGRWQTDLGVVDVQLSRTDSEITGLLWITAPAAIERERAIP